MKTPVLGVMSAGSFRFLISSLVGVVFFVASLANSQTPINIGSRKFRVSNQEVAAGLIAAGGKLLVEYGSFQLIEVPSTVTNLAALTDGRESDITVEDARILLNAGPIDTSVAPAQLQQPALVTDPGKRLHLIHFVGPPKPEWLEEVRATGVEVVTYIPNNAYLIYGEAAAVSAAGAPADGSALARFQDWHGMYLDSYKIDPKARTSDAAGAPREIGTDHFAVQLVADERSNPVTLALIKSLATGSLIRSEEKLNYYDVVAPLPADRLADIAARPDVISIQPYFIPEKFDERQAQIVAGNLTGNVPTGAGYLSWLTGAGFNQNQFSASGFAVDVTDSGVDNGTPSPNHFGLYRGGVRPGNSRVVYNRLEGTPSVGSTIRGADGHGNLNAHIIGGFNNLTGFPHQDSAGFRFGLGIAPFVRVGSSVIFDPDRFTSPNYTDLQSRAYADGARVSSNSWGANTGGAYNIDSQSYDALVRDAQPAGAAVAAAGNQEMVIVFANGNAGSGAQTVGSPATGKNVISVGAAENVQAFGGTDGSGVGDSGADSAADIIDFSSRGPCSDGRKKPEIVAPGTHVSGGVWQTANPGPTGTADPGYVGTGVSGGTGGSIFFPGNGSTQQFFTASSGTSHSTPCVAGGAALVRQYFVNRNLTAPSPAMTKSFLVNSARYLTGLGANDTLPSNSQGMGEMNLGLAFDGGARFLRDQVPAEKLTASGQTRVFTLGVVNSSKPLRATLAWTDAPGSTTGNAYRNDLDLSMVVAGSTYRGNVFAGASSVTGGTADPRNNLESVFLPAGFTGAVTVTVTASNINSDGVPGDANLLDQDFALVVYNALPAGTAAVAPNGSALVAESFAPANGLIDNAENVSVSFILQNSGNTALSNVVATLQNSGGVTNASSPQSYGALAVGASVARTYSFTASGAPGGLLTASLNLVDGATNLGTVTFTFRLAAGPVATPNGATITAESISPANGYIDPGETVTVSFGVANSGDAGFGNLTATLLASGGVTSPSGSQNYGALAPGASASRNFTFTGNGALGATLTASLQLQDGAASAGTLTYAFRIGPPPDNFTEIFDTSPNDTDNQSWLFTPNGSNSFYRVVRAPVTAFPTNPTGGTQLTLSDDSFTQVTPTGGVQVPLYGVAYSSFFVGSNGYITFGTGDSDLSESLADHFARARIAALFDDLNPGAGGTVSWRQTADRIAVTFQNVPEFSTSNANSFQIEMFFDGRIRVTCLGIAAIDGLIGLSRGLGTPADFVESDFSTYPGSSLQVTPLDALVANGLVGGPFTPASQDYTLTNTGPTPLNWTATNAEAWVRLSAAAGTLAPGASTSVTVSLRRNAAALPIGVYSDVVTFTETTNGVNDTRPISLTISDHLGVSPAAGLTSSGPVGGPFTPNSQVYTLTNAGTLPMDWTATKTQPWLTVSSAGGTLAPGATATVLVSVNAAAASLGLGAYTDTVTFRNLTSGVIHSRPVNLNVIVPPPDYFTELFDTSANDTDNQSWLFTPDGSANFYRATRAAVTAFPSDPTGGTLLPLGLDAFQQVTPTGGAQVRLYGVSYSSFFVSSKAYVTMGSGDFTFTESLAAHFSLPRIAALFDDLDPSVGGTISWKQFADHVAVTWLNVPEFGTTNANSCQIEMFFDGRIRITCLGIAAPDGLIGLSRGQDVPADFVESDFSGYPVSLLQVDPANGLSSSGAVGGPFTPSSQAYTVTNTSSNPIAWTVAKTEAWLTLSSAGGTLAPGASTSVTVSINVAASLLPLGTYSDSVTFTDTTNNAAQTRPVNVTVLDALAVTPASGLASSGPVGGPFAPVSQSYTLRNIGTAPISWTAAKTQTWLTLTGVGGNLAPGATVTVTVSINTAAALLGVGAYSDTVTFRNTTSGVTQTRSVSLSVNPMVPDYFTEFFDTSANDTDNQSWLFTPNGSNSFYRAVRTPVAAFPTDPTGGTPLTLSDDNFAQVTPTGGVQVRLYGVAYSTFFVGSNGYVTFGTGESEYVESLASHFASARIAALFDDLNPGAGGTVSWKQTADRIAVTFQNVPEFSSSNANSFQIEMFFDGRIRITCLAIAATDGILGLSRGLGTPADFVESDFSTYSTTALPSYEEWKGSTGIRGLNSGFSEDFDGDGVVNLLEWAFGTDPVSSSSQSVSASSQSSLTRGGPASLSVSGDAGGEVRLAIFARRKDYMEAGLNYTVEFSSDLVTWIAGSDEPTVVADDGEIEVVTVVFPAPGDGQAANFFRVKVTAW